MTLASGRYQYRNLKLSSGLLVANGAFDVQPNKDVVEGLRSNSSRRRRK
jgi:hypothetical protein